MNKYLLLGLVLLCIPFGYARVFDMTVVTPDTGCSIYGCTFMGDINMNGNVIYNATFVNASNHEFDPIFNAWLNSTYYPENQSIWNAINGLNQSLNQTQYVKKSGDTMTGNLNMSDNNITDLNILYVHNISGRSPIHILSDVISTNSITAGTFYGDINGQNGTIYGVTITNGTITNLHATNDAIFDSNVIVNGTVNASDYNLQGDNVWINKHNLTFEFNQTHLEAGYYNKTEVDALIANVTAPNATAINATNIEQVTCDGNCTTIIENEYID